MSGEDQEWEVSHLLFTDDTTLVGDSAEKIDWFEERKMNFNVGKRK